MHVCLGTVEEGQFLALFGRESRFVAAVGFKPPRQLNKSRRMIAEGIDFAAAIAEFA